MAPRLGTGFKRNGSALLQARSKGFWIVHRIWFAGAKNMERSHCSIFPILATQLWVMGSLGAGACWIMRLAHLERQMALGRQASGGYCLRSGGRRNFRGRLFRPNRPLGLGQPQAHGMGVLSHSAFPMERHHLALGFP